MLTRDQHLEFCRRCKNRDFDPQHGIICKLTGKIADFDPTCPSYTLDENVKIEKYVEPGTPPELVAAADLPLEVREAFRKQQDMSYAIVGGLASSVLGAVIWAAITYFTHYQIGYMAIAVGLITGFGVRYFGAGIDIPFGVVGAAFAVFGCLLGNLLSQIGFVAEVESMSYFQVIPYLNLDTILSIYKDSFTPMDLVFYGIAGYEGYKFAFRPIVADQVKDGSLPALPYAKYRFPAVATLFVLLSVGVYFVSSGSTIVRTVKYESGAKHYEGTVVNGKEQGAWTFWWENGKIQQTGFFKDGKLDSTWEYFNEEGVRYRRGTFVKGFQHGEGTEYHPNGQVAAIGSYYYDRLHGLWIYYFENGQLSQRGYYKLDLTDSLWEVYNAEGKPSSRGAFKDGQMVGPWMFWYEDGSTSLEIEYESSEHQRLLNKWSRKGEQLVKNGNGMYSHYFENGKLKESGKVVNGERVGTWKEYSESGQLLLEAAYSGGRSRVVNSWDSEGLPGVRNGQGILKSTNEEGVTVTVPVVDGLSEGLWLMISQAGDTLQWLTNVGGKENGPSKSYHPDGTLAREGAMKNGQRDGEWRWYHPNGELDCTINYVNGIKEGEQPFFDDEGTLTKTEVYRNGKLIEVKT